MKKYNCVCVIIMLCIINIISSCVLKRKHMYHFSQNDSLYFNIYDTLQYYTFNTNKGIDTLQIIKKHIKENYNEWYIDMVDGAIFEAYFFSEGYFKHNGSDEKIQIHHQKVADNQDPLFSIVIAERYADDIKDIRNLSESGIYRDTIVIDSTNSQQNHYEPHNFTFEYLKWHKYKGIVEYKLSDGTTYKVGQ